MAGEVAALRGQIRHCRRTLADLIAVELEGLDGLPQLAEWEWEAVRDPDYFFPDDGEVEARIWRVGLLADLLAIERLLDEVMGKILNTPKEVMRSF
jgi:hypothetical protein